MTVARVFPSDSTTAHAARPSLDALFSYGFRPFFLAAAVYAALVMSLWLVWIVTTTAIGSVDWLPLAGSPFAWHGHEMVFGFAVAAVAGFLLTAVPNWTGALPLSGTPLVVLFAIWLMGRIVMGVSGMLPYALVAAVDLAFLPTLGAFAAGQLFEKPALRNFVFLVIVAALTLGNIVFHMATYGLVAVDPLAANRISVLLVAIMIAIIGGRIIPAFTHNWLHLNGASGPMPRHLAWLDAASIIAIVIFVLLEALGAPDALTGATALMAAAFNGARLALWRGFSTRKEPIVWVLHLAYAWIVVGLALSAAASFTGHVSAAIASHAFGAGAIGTMIMAVMSRASLGHTGRRLVASRPIVAAYLLVTLAAVVRVVGPLLTSQYYAAVLGGAGVAWVAAFTLFVLVYAPILTTPRVHMKTMTAGA
jgi:uncharacterized protein involved in response to NO